MVNTYVLILPKSPDVTHHFQEPAFYNNLYLIVEEDEKYITIEVNSKTHQTLKFNKNFIDKSLDL